VKDILAFDPVELRAWHWDAGMESLVHFIGAYRFLSKPDAELSLAEVFRGL
jgi:hypothetical protein